MKSLRYKLACVFIILIFCLAPLGAIDLDNNTKYINQDDNGSDISVDDVNVTVDDDNQSKETDTEKATDNETDGLKTEYDPLEVHIDDVYVGDPAVVEVHADKSIHSLMVAWQDQWTYIEVHDGYASMTIDDLDCGNYVVDVYSDKSSQMKTAGFTVMPIRDSNLNVQVKDILGGEKAVAEVHTHDEYTGEVTLTLDGSETKTVKIEKGYGKVVFDSFLKPGNHNVVASASACHSFNASEKKASFSVSKKPFLDVEVSETFENDPINIKVNTAEDHNGFCLCFLNDGHSSNLLTGIFENGTYVGTFPSTYPAGNYSMRVQAIDYGNYELSEKQFDFTIKKKGKDDPNLSIEAKDIDAGEKVVAEVHADKGFTGNATVNLENETKTINIKDGYAKVSFDDELMPGEHKLQLSSQETDIYKASQISGTCKVRGTLALDVQYRNITQGERLELNLSATPHYNGFVLCTAGYCSLEFGYFENGHYSCIFDNDNIPAGDQPLTVLAFPDGPYEQTYKEYTFNVIKA